jgi:hypothetical protein
MRIMSPPPHAVIPAKAGIRTASVAVSESAWMTGKDGYA